MAFRDRTPRDEVDNLDWTTGKLYNPHAPLFTPLTLQCPLPLTVSTVWAVFQRADMIYRRKEVQKAL